MVAETTAGKQRGKPFKRGESGNPTGRPKGARHKATLAVETLLDGEAEALTRKAIELALAGDMTALRLCMDRIMPVRKDRPVTISLPEIENANDAAMLISAALAAVTSGEITPAEGNEIARMVETYVKAVELHEHEQRLQALEEKVTQ